MVLASKLLICSDLATSGGLYVAERPEGVEGALKHFGVYGKLGRASVTIEDGFGFEAVVPVKSPIKSSRWDALWPPAGFLV